MQGECSVQGKRERGPVGEKKSEGGYASPSSPVEPGRPPPPLPSGLQSQIPFHLTCVVLRYCQGAQAQRLARVGQV